MLRVQGVGTAIRGSNSYLVYNGMAVKGSHSLHYSKFHNCKTGFVLLV